MFKKVLVANRGVAAVRIARTLRRLGIPWVAVHSEADSGLSYVREADEAYAIGRAPARESYLKVEALLDIIQRSGCDAVHPGYGFLSEDPRFAQKVELMGARFIGPSHRYISAMGNKLEARERMEAAGIPVLPASGPIDEHASDFSALAAQIGLPMLVKAAAGGGGIGMQRVLEAGDLSAAVAKARQISSRAFGDETVYLERYLAEPRHVEFQLVGDSHGNLRVLFERDCSIQRRHQKVVEEAPAPALDRNACDAVAERLASAFRSWGYDSLGTVEMLLDRSGSYYFLETNTRLQVEHGVTEAVTGLDLVEIQLRIASGESLDSILPNKVERQGHALELRIYAEDPVRFFPSTGQLTRFVVPECPGVRVETHLMEGDVITPHYDPMIALVIAKGADRTQAIERALGALDTFAVEGVKTNVPFLNRLLRSEPFANARHHTAFAEELSRVPA